MLGTVHYVDKEMLKLNPEIHAALDAAECIYVEVVAKRIPEKTGDDQKISEEMKEKLELAFVFLLDEYNCSRQEEMALEAIFSQATWEQKVDLLLAWKTILVFHKAQAVVMGSTSIALNSNVTTTTMVGIETLLQARAEKTGTPLGELEQEDDERMQLLLDLRKHEKNRLLTCSKEEIKTFMSNTTELKEMFQMWKEGDLDKILERSQQDYANNPELRKRFLSDRNLPMADKMDTIMKTSEGPTFFAIGMTHIPGEDGVAQLLENKGWHLQKV